MKMLKIAIAKGRVAEKVSELLLDTVDYRNIIDLSSRKLIFTNKDKEVVFFLAKPSDVPVYVGSGAADVGIVGKDILMEVRSQTYEILDLKICRCRMVLAGPSEKEQARPIVRKIATKYPRISTEYFNSKSESVEIIKLDGSIELAPLMGLSDAIVDIVESGKTLKENGLIVYENICDITARMIVNRVSYKMKNKSINTFASAISTSFGGGGTNAQSIVMG
ncbi:MAG TPA: ATP phosphoribosyltransferase [Bacillota bacterium]|nr:ATP phosphoribosyltransferase [Bacillota bacterium]HPL53300.1 ATP phosphoribosyltransferase [Bacillota bacterium]